MLEARRGAQMIASIGLSVQGCARIAMPSTTAVETRATNTIGPPVERWWSTQLTLN
jgi:hypothetical protein